MGDPYARDGSGRRINSRGEVLDMMGNVIDNVGTSGYENARRSNAAFGTNVPFQKGSDRPPAQTSPGLISGIFFVLLRTGPGFVITGAIGVGTIALAIGWLVSNATYMLLPDGPYWIAMALAFVAGTAGGLVSLMFVMRVFRRNQWFNSGTVFLFLGLCWLIGTIVESLSSRIPSIAHGQVATWIGVILSLSVGGFCAFAWRSAAVRR